jgi:hypothetical protein
MFVGGGEKEGNGRTGEVAKKRAGGLARHEYTVDSGTDCGVR